MAAEAEGEGKELGREAFTLGRQAPRTPPPTSQAPLPRRTLNCCHSLHNASQRPHVLIGRDFRRWQVGEYSASMIQSPSKISSSKYETLGDTAGLSYNIQQIR